MAKMVFEWDDENIAQIARHGMTPEEVEYVVRSLRSHSNRSRSSTDPITFGRTWTGKSIAVVWSAVGKDPMVVRVITAYDVDPTEERP